MSHVTRDKPERVGSVRLLLVRSLKKALHLSSDEEAEKELASFLNASREKELA